MCSIYAYSYAVSDLDFDVWKEVHPDRVHRMLRMYIWNVATVASENAYTPAVAHVLFMLQEFFIKSQKIAFFPYRNAGNINSVPHTGLVILQ